MIFVNSSILKLLYLNLDISRIDSDEEEKTKENEECRKETSEEKRDRMLREFENSFGNKEELDIKPKIINKDEFVENDKKRKSLEENIN